jgi:hypothetical protein
MPMLTPLPRRHDAIIYYAISSPFMRLCLLPQLLTLMLMPARRYADACRHFCHIFIFIIIFVFDY